MQVDGRKGRMVDSCTNDSKWKQLNATGVVACLVFVSMGNNSPAPGRAPGLNYVNWLNGNSCICNDFTAVGYVDKARALQPSAPPSTGGARLSRVNPNPKPIQKGGNPTAPPLAPSLYKPINTATIRFFTEQLCPIPWSRFSGTLYASPIDSG